MHRLCLIVRHTMRGWLSTQIALKKMKKNSKMASIAMKKKSNMTYADKIRAIRAKITIFGGTTISLADSTAIVGFCARGVHGTGYFMLRDITADEKIVGINDDGVEITIPIHWLSETYLSYVLVHYYNACKEQLTESAMKEIDKILTE